MIQSPQIKKEEGVIRTPQFIIGNICKYPYMDRFSNVYRVKSLWGDALN